MTLKLKNRPSEQQEQQQEPQEDSKPENEPEYEEEYQPEHQLEDQQEDQQQSNKPSTTMSSPLAYSYTVAINGEQREKSLAQVIRETMLEIEDRREQRMREKIDLMRELFSKK